jgi:hypothetical protein
MQQNHEWDHTEWHDFQEAAHMLLGLGQPAPAVKGDPNVGYCGGLMGHG